MKLDRLIGMLLALGAALAFPDPTFAEPPEDGESTASTRQPDGLLERFTREPSVRAVQKRAIRHTGLDEGIDRSTANRVRLANLVPDIDAEAAWLDQNDSEMRYREEVETDDGGRMRRDSARNRYIADHRLRSIYSVQAEFHLGGLVFDRDEVAVAREHRRRVEARRRLATRTAELYFQRRRKQALYVAAPSSAWKRRMKLRLAIDRLTAQLDGLTGGWFSRKLEERRRDTDSPSPSASAPSTADDHRDGR